MNLLSDILDFLAPRYCAICGRRLSSTEEHVCATCLWHLPRTNYYLDPYENELAKLFWGRIPIEKATSWFFYKGHSKPTRMLLDLKYYDNKEIGEWMGRVFANEIKESNFFEDIDYIFPVPITLWHRFRRGYNQSLLICKGLSEITGIPVIKDVVRRTQFSGTQTRLSTAERVENVRNAFRLTTSQEKIHQLEGKHILLVDDVITTGSTIAACAVQLARISDIHISILSIGRTEL